MKYYRFKQTSPCALPKILEKRTDFFEFTDPDGTSWLYIPFKSLEQAEQLIAIEPALTHYETVEINDYVDWGVQWSDHSPDFKDYCLQVDLAKYTDSLTNTPTLYVNAGPGFGDLSHPTTRLSLKMMAKDVKNKSVLDIGCGSGILSLAAILLGAEFAWGLDIDEAALAHAEENARFNKIAAVQFMKPEDFNPNYPQDLVIVMNMIRSQQTQAWASLPQIHSLHTICITSGILASEKTLYLQECRLRGWKLLEEQQQGDWMGFRFIT